MNHVFSESLLAENAFPLVITWLAMEFYGYNLLIVTPGEISGVSDSGYCCSHTYLSWPQF